MRAGRLRFRVTIERDIGRAHDEVDELGQTIPRWQALARNVPVGIELKSGGAQDVADQRQAIAVHVVTMRRLAITLQPGDRIVWRPTPEAAEVRLYVDACGDPRGKGRDLTAYCRSPVGPGAEVD